MAPGQYQVEVVPYRVDPTQNLRTLDARGQPSDAPARFSIQVEPRALRRPLDLLASHPDATSRVIQGVVTGVGFLGAGSIIRGHDEESVRGLTTAASIWLAAATGIACGTANWPLVMGACLLGLLVLTITPVERVIHNRRKTDQKDPPPFP